MKKILSLLLLIPGILAVMSVSASCQKSRETAPALVSPLVATEGQAVSDSAQQVSSEAAITTGQKEQDGTTLIYKCDMKKMIAAPLWRSVKKSFVEADSLNAAGTKAPSSTVSSLCVARMPSTSHVWRIE